MKIFLEEQLANSIRDTIWVHQSMINEILEEIAAATRWVVETLKSGNKLMLFGNGGSAADAQHIAAEFVGRFERERLALPAIALTTDTSVLTALSNDYGGEIIFARQIEALGQTGDLVLAFSTSGNSQNVLEGVRVARERGIRTIGFTGMNGGKLVEVCDLVLRVPSQRTSRIQEAHTTISHAICEAVESSLFDSNA